MGIVQVGTIGVCSLFIALISGNFTFYTTPANYLRLLFLAIVCSGFGFTLQPLCQKKVDTATAGMFCALSPLSCTVIGAVFLHEVMTPAAFLGCVLVISGAILPHLPKGIPVNRHFYRS